MRVDGRWFVSPAGTALDIIDNVLQHMTRQELYTVLRVPQELPATGTLTLGQPQRFDVGDSDVRALSFDGHAGEKLLGEISQQKTSRVGDSTGAVAIYGPDGQPVDAGAILSGTASTLPLDGTYKILERSFVVLTPSDITLWDEANAPASAKVKGSEQCTTDINGEGSCFSSSSGILGTGSGPICVNPDGSPGSVATFDSSGNPVCPSGQTPVGNGATECISTPSTQAAGNGFKSAACPLG
jgi:hypothetical protein